MPKDSLTSTGIPSSIKDTTSIITLHLGKNNIRLPKYFTWPIIVLLFSIVAIIVFFPYTSTVQSFMLPKKGSVSKETIIAPLTFSIIKSHSELEQERKEAQTQVLAVFDRNSEKQKQITYKFLSLRKNVQLLNDEETETSIKDRVRTQLKRELSINTIKTITERSYLLDDAIFQAERMLETGISSILLVKSEAKLNELREEYNLPLENYLIYDRSFITLRQDSLETTVKVSGIPVKDIALEMIIHLLKVERMFDQEALNSLYELLDAYLIPNIYHNGEETEIRRQLASKTILSTKGKVIKDTEIVRKHQEVTAEILEKLKSLEQALQSNALGKETRRIFQTNLGRVLLVIVFLIMIGYYITTYHHNMVVDAKHLTALALIVALQQIVIRISFLILPKLFDGGGADIGTNAPEFLIPTAIASILITILFNFKISIVITLFISLYFGVAHSFNYSLFIYSLFGGFLAGFSTQKIRYRGDFFKAIPPIIAGYAVFMLIWNLISFNFSILAVTQNIGFSIINCITTIFLAMMFVSMFEYLFDITTNMTLVELSDMNNPLLKRLSIEAPGTYNHSVLVANLAESAAERVNANPLLARVASYYHDVGKIAKPNYFVENQKTDKNIHDKLSPSMSALIISSHIKEGLELAKKFKLPSVIRNSIGQHHGTSTVSFFYEKALEQDPHKQVKEKDFCYPGPRPQTRENAIIMLADSVEAASRSLSESSPKMLRALVKKIIHNKFASSQLDECNLTFQDLDKIIEGFMPVLHGIFHTRIEYPNKK